MKRIFSVSIVLVLLLTACSAPVQQANTRQSEIRAYGVYRLEFSVECLSGGNFSDWDVRYSYDGKRIENGYQLHQSPDVFAFRSVRVDMAEWNDPNNTFSTALPIAVCNGGSGKTEMTVIDSHGKTATFQFVCNVIQAKA